jgi:hypothetical protein
MTPSSIARRALRRPALRGALATAAVLAAGAALPAAAGAATSLDADVLSAVRAAGFDQTIDSAVKLSGVQGAWYGATPETPQVDVSVLELDAKNRVRNATNVLLSRDYPNGVVVPVGSDLSSKEVRYRKWDANRYHGTNGATWTAPYADGEDVAPGREDAALQFMAPYTASTLKVMVAFGIMQQVDAGKTSLDTEFTYGGKTTTCYDPGGTKTVRAWMHAMITESNNEATCAMIVYLHQLDAIDGLNDYFATHGMPTLTLKGTSASDGGGWSGNRGVFMGSLDTAKLLWLIDGDTEGTLWKGEDGVAVTDDELSASSRAFLREQLAGQGFNEVASTTNWCGATLGSEFGSAAGTLYPAAGIPTATPAEFLGTDGSATVEGVPYGQDTRPCNDAAEVVFSHKTGLTSEAGSDVGYVRSLPGQRQRHYVLAVFSNLGNRYGDALMNASATNPYQYGCWTSKGICYSQAFAKLGKGIDDALKAQPQIAYGDAASATVGQPFELRPTRAEVGADATWTTDATLPAGLTLDRATGVLAGTPTAATDGVRLHVTATDDTGAGDTLVTLRIAAAAAAPSTPTAPAAPTAPAPTPVAPVAVPDPGAPLLRVSGSLRLRRTVLARGGFRLTLRTDRVAVWDSRITARVPARLLQRGAHGLRTVRLANGFGTLRAGTSTRSVRLTAAGRRVLRGGTGALRATARTTVRDADGRRRTATTTLRLR